MSASAPTESTAEQLGLAELPGWWQRPEPCFCSHLACARWHPGRSDVFGLLLAAARLIGDGDVSLARAANFAAEQVGATGRLNDLSRSTYVPLWTRFASFCQVLDVTWVREVDEAIARRWITAPKRGGGAPSASTQHLRRAALRLLFAVLRDAGIAMGDPTIDIALPPRSSRTLRPLTDAELDLCEWNALGLDSNVSRSTTFGLAESGLSTT